MTYREKEQLLIDYAEGILSADHKKHVEHMLRDSPVMQEEFAVIKTVFQALQTLPNETVPEHYFSNFLPRLRNKIDANENYAQWFFSRWVETLLVLGVIVILIAAFGILYQYLEPSEIQSPLYTVVKEIDQNDLNGVVEEIGNYEIFNGSIQSTEQLIDRLSHADEISQKISAELFSVELLAAQMESDWVELLEEREIDLVLRRLHEPELH